MAQNIASIIAINNLLYDQNYDNINNNNNDNNNTYLSLLNKYRKFLAIVCLNCKCDQNVNNNSDNQLCDKFNELENQYKCLVIHNIEHQNKRSNDEVIDDSNHIHCKRVKRQSIERSEVIVIEDSDEHSDDTTRAPHIDALNDNTDRSDGVSQLSSHSCDVSARKVFNDHIIDVETVEKVTNNIYVTKLLSTKSQSLNQVIGFRCKLPDCELIVHDITAALTHVYTDHNINRRFKCCNCSYYCKTAKSLRNHKNNNCKKIIEAKETLLEDNQYIARVEGSDWKSVGFVCKWLKCKFFSTSKSTIFEHLKTHSSLGICLLCDRRFLSKREYYFHSKTHDNISKVRRISDISVTEIPQNNECKDINDNSSDNEMNPKKYILFCNHIIDTDTYDENEENKEIARIRSKKPELINEIIGYRCTRKGCQFMNKSRKIALSHFETSHAKRKTKKNKN